VTKDGDPVGGVAKDTGPFEVELHPSTQIAQLDVVP